MLVESRFSVLTHAFHFQFSLEQAEAPLYQASWTGHHRVPWKMPKWPALSNQSKCGRRIIWGYATAAGGSSQDILRVRDQLDLWMWIINWLVLDYVGVHCLFFRAPFTIQRLCELIISPGKHYRCTDKYLRGIEKVSPCAALVWRSGPHSKNISILL